jgi:ParB family transcriptional regulator, chromosome partitioning protein
MKAKRGLGRGLDALFPTAPKDKGSGFQDVPIEKISRGLSQPRQEFDSAGLDELSNSIKHQGILQPLILRERDDGYEIIVGERRWRAAVKAGLATVPAVIRNVGDLQALEFGLIENLQRRDLNPLEEGTAYKILLEMSHWTQEELAQRVGKDRSTISNMIRLLSLQPEVKACLKEGTISIGHAKVLLAVEDDQQQVDLCRRIIKYGLSVRQTEALIKHQAPKNRKPASEHLDVHLRDVQQTLTTNFQTKVTIQPGKKINKIIFEYYSLDDLNRLLEIFDVL